LAGGLFAQEIQISGSFDFWTKVKMEKKLGMGFLIPLSYDEKASLSATVKAPYLQRFAKDSIRVGLGLSFMIPRTTDYTYKPIADLKFSDFAGYAELQVYPIGFFGKENLLDGLYIKGNAGINFPILIGDWAKNYVDKIIGGFYFGFAAGMAFPFGLFFEVIYNNYSWGATISDPVFAFVNFNLDNARYHTFAVAVGWKIKVGK
jgi:hypothetical protein